eukprot:6127420-Prymnesium_polylepis.1
MEAESTRLGARLGALPLVEGVAVPWASCKREGCPCTASFSGLPDEFCCFMCRDGQPCTSNIHQGP